MNTDRVMWIILVVLVGMLILAGAAQKVIDAPRNAAAPIPLEVGTYWVYSGTVRWSQGPAANVKEFSKQLRWKTEVVRRLDRGNLQIAELLGHPSDLAFYDASRRRGRYLLVINGSEYYLIRETDAVVKRLDDPHDTLDDLYNSDEMFLCWPVKAQGCFDNRGDGLYCWRLEKQDQTPLTGVKGLTDLGPYRLYQVSYRSNPQHEFMDIVPSVGITSYTFGHHGTLSEVDMRLTEFHRGAPASAPPAR